MKILSQTDDRIQYLYHLSDIHLRNHSRHEEYRNVFKRLYQKLKDEIEDTDPNSGLIVLTGDIVHSKSQISPQLIIELRDFLTNLANIMPVILIAGNHDLNLANKDVPDTLTSILHKIEIPNLHYLKHSGIYKWNNVQFGVMSVLDYPLIKASEFPKQGGKNFKIGLLHATLHGSKISTSNMPLTSDKYKAGDFDGYDYVLLGDIHLHQYMNAAKTIAYAGSLIQQSFGEELHNHGYLKWFLDEGHSELIEVPNDYGFVNLYIKNENVGPEAILKKLPEMLNVKLRFMDNSSHDVVDRFLNELKTKNHIICQTIIVPFTPNLESPSQALPTLEHDQLPNLVNTEYQKSLIEEYLGKDFEQLDAIQDLHDQLVRDHNDENDSTCHQWKLLNMEFENAFSFKGENYIDFTQFRGIVGIIGPNFSGKSNIIDILLFGLFDKASRGERNDIITANQESMSIKIAFRIGHTRYTIHRTGKVTFSKEGEPKYKIDVKFYTAQEDLTGENRHHTNRLIQNLIGTYEDFILTTLKLQDGGLGNLINLTNSQRKERLVDLLRLNILDEYAKLGNNRLRDNKKALDLYQKELSNLPEDLVVKLERVLDELISDKTAMNVLKLQLENDNLALNDLNSQLQPVDLELANREYQELPTIDPSQIRDLDVKLKDLNNQLSDLKCRLKPLFYGMTLDELNDNISLYQDTIDDQTVKLIKAEKHEKEQQTLLKGLLGNREHFQRELKDYPSVVERRASLQSWIKRCTENNQKLLDLEYDSECKYCMNNIFVQDAINCRDELKGNEEKLSRLEAKAAELESIQSELVEVEKEIQELQNEFGQNEVSMMKAELKQWKDELGQLRQDLKNLEDNLDIQEKIKELDQKIIITQQDRDELWDIWDKSRIMEKVKLEKQKEEANLEIREKIDSLVVKLKESQHRRDSLEQKIMNLSAEEQMYGHQIDRQRDLVKKIKDLKNENIILDIYVQCLGKDGIPKYLISKYLPEFERVVNLIMEDLVNFRIRMEISDKKWNLYVVYEDRKLNLDLCSGYEKFVVGLAVKCALFHLSQMSKPQFMVVDEGFGSLDQRHLNEIGRILNYLRSKYDFVLLITHIEAIKDELDQQLEIKRIGEYSKVNNRAARKMILNFKKKTPTNSEGSQDEASNC